MKIGAIPDTSARADTCNRFACVLQVASFGLEPSKHLGKSIQALRPFFEKLHSRCGFHVCGEGGEYETLTLDCPLFVRRLVSLRCDKKNRSSVKGKIEREDLVVWVRHALYFERLIAGQYSWLL